MIKRLLIFLVTLFLFVLIALFLKSGDISIFTPKYHELASSEINKYFNTTGLLNLDSTNVSDSIFKNKLSLVQFSFHGCGACRRDKQLFPNVLDSSPEGFQIVTISIDNYNFWKKDKKNESNWKKINIGNSDLRNQLNVKYYPTYFIVNESGTIVSHPSNGIAFIRNYYNIGAGTTIQLFVDYLSELKETKRIWSYIFQFTAIYFLVLGVIFCIVSLVICIRHRLFSKKVFLIWFAMYVLANMFFFNLIYFTDGRGEIQRVNTKNHNIIGELFQVDSLNLKYPNNPISFNNKLTLINFFHMNSPLCMLEICSMPSFLSSMPDSIQVLSFGVNNLEEYNRKIKDSVFVGFNVTTQDTTKWKINYLADTLRWRQFHVSELGDFVNFVNKLDIRSAPEAIIVDENGRIIEKPINGTKFLKIFDKREPSFKDFYEYLKRNGGVMASLVRGFLFFIGVLGIVELIRFIIKGKKYISVTRGNMA